MLALDELVFFVCFNDAGGVLNRLPTHLNKFKGKMNPVQVREVLAEFGFVNYHILERPTFVTKIDMEHESSSIEAVLPKTLNLADLDFSVRGDLMAFTLKGFLAQRAAREYDADLHRQLVEGSTSFLTGRTF